MGLLLADMVLSHDSLVTLVVFSCAAWLTFTLTGGLLHQLGFHAVHVMFLVTVI